MSEKEMMIEEVKKQASEKAKIEGYDQVVYKQGRKKARFRRTTSQGNLSPDRVICYVRLFYKDGCLETRICEA